MKRTLALLTLALCVAGSAIGSPVTAEGATIADPEVTSGEAPAVPGALSGAEAVVALERDDELTAVAADVGWTAAELTSTLLTDDAAFVTEDGSVGYAEPAPDASVDAAAAILPAAAGQTSPLALHSNPDASLTILLDFDGHVTTNTTFNTRGDSNPANDVAAIDSAPFDRDGNPGALSGSELAEIGAVWQIVAEDFAPFDVDVTTEDPGPKALGYSGAGDTEYGIRVVISPTDEWVGAKYGGLAYVGSFRSSTPAFVFTRSVRSYKEVGDAVSHEVGHTLGLAHQGTSLGMYYGGHDAWGPIMGSSYRRELAQWSKGEYAGADNREDDLAVLAASLGFRVDDHGNTAGTATLIAGTGAASGFVGADDAVDVFAVDVVGGGLEVSLTPTSTLTDLFASVTIRNAAGDVVATNTPTAVTSAPIGSGNRPIDWVARATTLVPDGRYTVEVRPAGLGTTATGFSAYGSHGTFRLTVAVGDVQPEGGQVRLTPIQPVRLADTRSGQGGAPRLTADGVLRVQVAGVFGVPTDVTAASLNITAVGPDSDGFVTAYACSETPPTTSTVNFAAGRDIANATIATLGDDGAVCVYSSTATDVIVDITAWFSPSAATGMTATAPHRVADTRSGLGGATRVAAGDVLTVETGDTGAAAVALNVTAVGADEAGFLTVYPCGTLPPVTSTVNFAAAEARPNNTIVATSPGGQVCVYTSATADIIVDVTGAFSTAARLEYLPAAPRRLLDTRATDAVAANGEIAFVVPSAGASAEVVSVNVTATGHDTDGFTTTFGCGTAVPEASTLNQRVGEANANGAIVPTGASSTGCLYTSSATNLIVDLNGWWVATAS